MEVKGHVRVAGEAVEDAVPQSPDLKIQETAACIISHSTTAESPAWPHLVALSCTLATLGCTSLPQSLPKTASDGPPTSELGFGHDADFIWRHEGSNGSNCLQPIEQGTLAYLERLAASS